MKLVTVEFDDSVDISILPNGTSPVNISDGTNTLSEGKILALSDVLELESELETHTHPLPSGESGPPIVV